MNQTVPMRDMRFLWLDTETTGLEPHNSSIFQAAMILVENGKVLAERCFFLNPLSSTILYDEAAGKIHGYSKEHIASFPPEKTQIVLITDFLTDARERWQTDGSQTKKLTLCGYNIEFDRKHLQALLARNGYRFDDYFSKSEGDVLQQVRAAGRHNLLPKLANQKLETVARHFGIPMEKAHDALCDIRTTRQIARTLYRRGIQLLY